MPEELTAEQKENLEESLQPDANPEYRFNNGNGAILCSVCRTIIQVANQIDWVSLKAGTLKPQYCDDHKIHAG